MKKFYTWLFAAALPLIGSAQAKTTPYQTLFYLDTDWVVTDNNADGKTWIDHEDTSSYSSKFGTSGYTTGKKYGYNKSNAGDDWLIGPAIHLEANKEYKLKFYFNRESYEELITLYMASSNTIDDLKAGTVMVDISGKTLEDGSDNKDRYYVKVFTVDTDGDYYFGFWEHSAKNMFNAYITGFQLRENVFAPGAPTDVTVTPGADRALEATLTWALPTKDVDGADMEGDLSYESVTITRDGVVVATLDGSATTWTDNAAAGLTSGKHTYGVRCKVNGAESPEAIVNSNYIGPIAPQAVPYDAGINSTMSADDFADFWHYDRGRESTATESQNWHFYTSTYSSNYIEFPSSGKKVYDEWLISPELNFTEAGVYKLSLGMNYSVYNVEHSVTVYLGNGETLGGYTDEIAVITPLSYNCDKEVYFEITEPCIKSIALNLKATSNSSSFKLEEFKVDPWHRAPGQAEETKVEVSADRSNVTVSWKNPSIDNTGAAITALTKVDVKMDDEVVATLTEGINPGEESSVVVTPETNGTHAFAVVPYIGENAPDVTPVVVRSGWVGSETQPLPYTCSFLSTDATKELWSGFDANNDGSTFYFNDNNSVFQLDQVSEATVHDDYALSPYINFDKAGYYRVKWSVKGGGLNYILESGKVTDKNNVAATFSKISEIKMIGRSWTEDYDSVLHIEAPEVSAIAIHTKVDPQNIATSDDYYIGLSTLKVEYLPVTPTKPVDAKAVEGENDALSVTVSWKNPTTSNIQGVVPEVGKAIISRKLDAASQSFEVLDTITDGMTAGEITTYVDNNIPEVGVYIYQIVLEGPEGKASDAYVQVASGWVGPGKAFPVSYNINPDDPGMPKSDMRIFNLNNDSHDDGWDSYPITWEMSYSGTSLYIDSSADDTDDWATTSFYQFNEGDQYLVTVESYTTSKDADNNPAQIAWEFWHLKTAMPEDADYKIMDVISQSGVSDRQRDSIVVNVVAPETLNPEPEEETPVANVRDMQHFEHEAVSLPSGKGTFGFHACNPGDVNVRGFSIKVLNRAAQSVTLDKTELPLLKGATGTITAVVGPDDTTDKTVVWTSSDENVATVDAEGVVTAVGAGSATITATCGKATATCEVVVTVLAESVTIAAETTEVTEGDELQLTATVLPEDTSDKTVTWSSTDEAVATVSETGLVSALTPGNVTIKAACGDVEGSIDITVKERIYPAESVTLDQTEILGSMGDTFQLTATVAPDNTTDKTVTWTTSDETIATVSETGLVTCVTDGEATITATCGDVSATCKVKIVTVGISAIPADARADARFFNLQGIEVKGAELTPGIYIARFMHNGEVQALKIRY